MECECFKDTEARVAEEFSVWCERRQRVKQESRMFGLSIWEDTVVISWDGEKVQEEQV